MPPRRALSPPSPDAPLRVPAVVSGPQVPRDRRADENLDRNGESSPAPGTEALEGGLRRPAGRRREPGGLINEESDGLAGWLRELASDARGRKGRNAHSSPETLSAYDA